MKSKIPIKKKCEWCGKDFIAYKVTTRFCCKQCNSYAYKDKLRNQRIREAQGSILVQEQNEIASKGYLSPKETAMLLSVDRVTVYRYLWDGLLTCIRMRGKTFIRKADIEKMFNEAKPYQKRHKKVGTPITEFYKTSEILQKYGISESGLYKIAKSETFPKVFQRGKSYWSKKHIDSYFGKKAVDASITEWYSVADMKEKFNMTTTAVYTFVSNFKIPKKRIKKEVLYSKRHVDMAKGIAEPDTPQYYTIKEAMAKFHVTRDQLYHYAKTYNIPKVQEGKYVKLSKKELDELFAPPTIKG